MRDDLLDAYAAVDWARAQIPVIEKEFESWRDAPAYLLVEEPHPEMSKKLFKLQVNRPFPATLNAHVGATVNSARTSLDLLASAIAGRNGHTPHRDRHFPFYDSFEKFSAPKAVKKREKWLTPSDCKIIEDLRPYEGGDNLLFALHYFDIVRKHERLISVQLMPTSIIVTPQATAQGLQFPIQWPGFKDGAVIAWTSIDATNCEFQIPADIKFAEAPLMGWSLIPTLRKFAGLADSIIQTFE